jgi:hypothetical protein
VLQRLPEAQFHQGDEPAGKALRVSLPDCNVTVTVDLVPAFEADPETRYVPPRRSPYPRTVGRPLRVAHGGRGARRPDGSHF